MIFDGHSDLLYDVTRRRLAGENCVLERRHRQKLRKGRIGGLGLSLWVTAEPDSFWAAYPGWDGWRRTVRGWFLCGRRRKPVRFRRRAKPLRFWRSRAWSRWETDWSGWSSMPGGAPGSGC